MEGWFMSDLSSQRAIAMMAHAVSALIACGSLFPSRAAAQSTNPLPPQTQLVAASGAPAATQETFTIAAAQDLIVTFTDFKTPAPVSAASVVVTQGASIVGMATLAPP